MSSPRSAVLGAFMFHIDFLSHMKRRIGDMPWRQRREAVMGLLDDLVYGKVKELDLKLLKDKRSFAKRLLILQQTAYEERVARLASDEKRLLEAFQNFEKEKLKASKMESGGESGEALEKEVKSEIQDTLQGLLR